MTIPTIDDLTKQELIDIINGHYIPPQPDEIAWIIYQRRFNAAMAKMDEAMQEMQKYHNITGVEARLKWMAASDRWDKVSKEPERAYNWYVAVKREIEATR